MALGYITASRLLLVLIPKVCENMKMWFQLVYQNLSGLQYCVLLPCVYDFETSYVSGSLLQFRIYPHMSCILIEFCNDFL